MDYQKKAYGLSRKRFLSHVLPGCSLVCLGANRDLLGFSPVIKKALQETKHKFDEEFPNKLTNRQVIELMYGRAFIPVLNSVSEEIGKEKLIPMLKRYSAARGKEVGEMLAKQYGGNDFPTWKKIFSPDNPIYKISLTFNVAEEKEDVYEINVTECIWASVFLKAEAGDLGFASVCFGDYAMATGFNPDVKMVRDKTLMQGHDCCDHRYLLGA